MRGLADLIGRVSQECSVHVEVCVVSTVRNVPKTQFFGNVGVARAHLTTLIKEEAGEARSRYVAPIVQMTDYKSVECLIESFEQMLQDCDMAGKAIITLSNGQVQPVISRAFLLVCDAAGSIAFVLQILAMVGNLSLKEFR